MQCKQHLFLVNIFRPIFSSIVFLLLNFSIRAMPAQFFRLHYRSFFAADHQQVSRTPCAGFAPPYFQHFFYSPLIAPPIGHPRLSSLFYSDEARGLQHSTALNDLLLRAVVIAYEVAALFGTQTLHWFAFRGYFFAGGDAQLTPHTNKVLWGPRSPRQTHRYNYSTIQLLRRGTPRLYKYSQHFPSTPVALP